MLRDNSCYWLFHSEMVHVNTRFCCDDCQSSVLYGSLILLNSVWRK
ncbi:hypothetical protein PUND_a0859 [Pseudoalteromonas undina]|nr:hypothetical protein PUND_a0859 [Pseudoalteromonas undina]